MDPNNEIQRSLGRIEAKLDAALNTISGHEKDIDDLKAAKNKAIGIIGLIGALFGALGANISQAIGKVFH